MFSSAASDDPKARVRASQAQLAIRDIVDGARASYLWGLLGWQDIRQRYRRTRLGPFWLTISMGAMVGGIGLLYAGLFRMSVADYLPFLAVGFIVWGLISNLVIESCLVFIQAEPIIKQSWLPLSIHVYRIVWRNAIIFGHNFAIYVVVAIVFGIWPGWLFLLAVVGLALICLNGVWVGLLLGLAGTRFRDIPQIVASLMQIVFFLTPIMWKPETLVPSKPFLQYNPFYHFLELMRAPLLGHAPAYTSWLAALGVTIFGWILALIAYQRYRRRIAYWL